MTGRELTGLEALMVPSPHPSLFYPVFFPHFFIF